VFPRFSNVLVCFAGAILISGTTALDAEADADVMPTGISCPEILFLEIEHHDGGRPADVACSDDGA
jgi:hypothetical protein